MSLAEWHLRRDESVEAAAIAQKALPLSHWTTHPRMGPSRAGNPLSLLLKDAPDGCLPSGPSRSGTLISLSLGS